MEVEQYYTPSIEEFHVGFEYEFLTGGNVWKSFIFDLDRPEKVLSNIKEKPEMFRVKYLDKEDIESLGWKFDKYKYLTSYYKYLNFILEVNDRFIGSKKIPIKLLDTFNLDTNCNFYIKNKSELKILMKQTFII